MPDESEKSPRGTFTAVSAHLRNILNWSSVDKCLISAGVTLAVVLGVALIMLGYLSRPEEAPYFNLKTVRFLLPALWTECALWLAVLLTGFTIRKRNSESRTLVYITAGIWGLGRLTFLYLIGPHTSAYAVLALAGAVVGVLFFERRPILQVAGFCMALYWVLEIATLLGWVPYAPLLRGSPFEEQRLHYSWWSLMGSATHFDTVVLFLVVVYVVTRWRDREERLANAYRELADTKDQLVRAESLAAIGSLVTGTAHELRNPLASSSALFQSLRDDLQGAEGIAEEIRRDALETIDMALKGQRRAALIGERLYSVSEALAPGGEKRRLSSILETLRSRYPDLRIEAEPETVEIEVNERSFLLSLSNLLENAVRASGEAPPGLSVTRSDGRLRLCVSDSGPGIDPALRPTLFRPFAAGRKTGEGHGVGLGLYIVHELVQRLGGSVEIESEPGKGARVTLEVPFEGSAASNHPAASSNSNHITF